MFEFTEDKKGIRPKWVGTIENNLQRRAMMVLMLLPTMAVVIGFNLVKFVLFTLLVFSRLVVYGTLKVIITPFLNWPYWHEPRRPVPAEPLHLQRMRVELAELNDKRQKLTDFLQGEVVKTLPEVDHCLLIDQWRHMLNYANVLEKRINRAVSKL